MKKKRLLLIPVGCVILVCAGVLAYAWRFERPANELGLTRQDMAMGQLPNIEALRESTEAVSDPYVAALRPQLNQLCGDILTYKIDYSLTPKIRSLGYRSSFYYYCWNILLPYSVETESREKYILVVQLSDAVQGRKHDPDKFKVIRSTLIDKNDQKVKTL